MVLLRSLYSKKISIFGINIYYKMKTITAEFDWANFLIIILGIILGLNRSRKKKKQDLPSNEEVSSTETDKQLVEEVIVPENHFSSFQEEDISLRQDKKNDLDDEEGETIPLLQFDLRQAIIMSEILNRPRAFQSEF